MMSSRHTRSLWRAILLLVCLAWGAATVVADPPAAEGPAFAVRIVIDDVIHGVTRQFLFRRVEEARKLSANVLILEIESPGGTIGDSMACADLVRDIKWARTVAYVPKMALSGAAMLSLACDDILLDPSARIGDVGPLVVGKDAQLHHAPQKVVSDIAVVMGDLARAKGRPGAIAEAMVDRAMIVIEAKERATGKIEFFAESETRRADWDKQWERIGPLPESGRDRFLTATGRRAVELRVANATVGTYDELLARYAIEGQPVTFRYTWMDTLILVLNHPVITGILLVVGLICLYLEFMMLGFGIAGIVSGLCFLLFFWSHALGGTSGWLEVLLFLAGVLLLAAELFLIPGFGVTGLSGLLLILASFIMASQDFIIPTNPVQTQRLVQSLATIAISFVVFLAGAIGLGRYLPRTPLFRLLVLGGDEVAAGATPADGIVATALGAPSNAELTPITVGAEGVTQTPLRPSGRILIDERSVDVVADGFYVPQGARVRVIASTGNRVLVRQV